MSGLGRVPGPGPIPVEPHEQPRSPALELDRSVAGVRELLPCVQPLQHPADRRRSLARLLAIDCAGHDQPVDRARHRDVIEPEALGIVLALRHRLDLVVAARALEAEAPVRQREDLVRRRRLPVASGIGDDDDLEFEPLRAVDRQQAHGVAAFFLRDGLELPRAHRFLLGDEVDEAFDVRPAQLLVRTREPRQLAQVGVAAAAVPAREHGEVVVVLGDDPLAEQLE